MAKAKKSETENTNYSKEALLKSQKYLEKRDLISILLDDETEYSLDEVDGLIEEFLNKEVN